MFNTSATLAEKVALPQLVTIRDGCEMFNAAPSLAKMMPILCWWCTGLGRARPPSPQFSSFVAEKPKP